MSATARSKFCPECGVKFGQEDLFCGGCGAPVTSASAVGAPNAMSTPSAASVDGAAPRRGVRYLPLVIALTALGVVGAATFALGRRGHASSASAGPAPSAASAPAPRYFDYTMNVDLSELRAPTQVRVEIEDPDGRRVVEDRRRRRGERVRATARAKGETVTWRVYYDGMLVKTVRASSDGRSS